MKTELYLLFVLCTIGLLLTGCRKNVKPEDHTAVPPPAEPTLLLDSLIYYEPAGDGSLGEWVTTFSYDTAGRLTGSIAGGKRLYDITYNGTDVSSITRYNVNGDPYLTVEVPTTLTISDDSISFYTTNQNAYGTLDTIRESFLFDGELLTERKYYITSPEPNRSFFSRRSYQYTSEGNLKEFTREYAGSVSETFTVTSTDDKKNIWRNMPLDLILGSDWIECGSSINNITGVDYANNEVGKLEWTYNDYGYPLTLIYGDVDYVQLRFVYREK